MVNTETGNRRYHRIMSEQPPAGPPAPYGTGGFPTSSGQFPGSVAAPPPRPSTPPRGQSRALTDVALAIALIATVLAIIGWFRPSASQQSARTVTPTYSPQQISDAKARACNAVDTVHKGAILHSGTGTQQSIDPAMAEAQAADGRLAVIAGGWYLRDHLDPAAPPTLVDEIRHLSQVMLDLGANYLAGAKNADPNQAALIEEGNTAFERAQDLCK
jgi:hypothetical protein